MAAGPVISIRNLSKVYPRQRGLLDLLHHSGRSRAGAHALRGIDLEVYAAEVLGLVGPNGAGKSTLLRILANLVTPNAGQIVVAGLDARTHALQLRHRIGYVPSDERSFFWRMTGLDNLRFFATLHEVPPPRAEERIGLYLDLFSLRQVAQERFATYSAGIRKLFTIVRGLLPAPVIVVLDEPTNSLDPPTARKLMQHVRQELVARQGCSIVWATHRLEEVPLVCDHVLLIDRGQLRFRGTVDEFLRIAPAEQPGQDSLASAIAAFEERLIRRP